MKHWRSGEGEHKAQAQAKAFHESRHRQTLFNVSLEKLAEQYPLGRAVVLGSRETVKSKAFLLGSRCPVHRLTSEVFSAAHVLLFEASVSSEP